MARTVKFMGFLALIVLAHVLWSLHAERRGGGDDDPADATTTTSSSSTSPSLSAPTAESFAARTPASWPMYRGDAAMSGACEGRLGDKLKLVWRFRAGKDAATADKAAVKSSAVIDGGKVFIGANNGKVYALDLDNNNNGEELWSFPAGAAVSAPPMLLGDRVIVGDERGVVYCLDASDGSPRWTTTTGAKVVAAANHFVDSTGRDCVLVGSWDRSLYCLSASDGQTLWSIPMGNYVNAPCSLEGNTAALPVCDGSVRVLDLAAKKVVWEMPTSGMVASAVALRSGRGYAADSNGGDNLYCIDLSSGNEVWKQPLSGPTLSPASVTADRVLVATSAMSGAALHCFTLDGQEVWRHEMSAGSSAGPLVVGDRVLLAGDDGYLRLLRLSDGGQIDAYRVGGCIESSPAVAGGYIVVGCNDGYVYAFRTE